MNRGRSNLGVFLLAFEMFSVGIDRIPKVTLAAIVGQVVIYLRLIPVLPLRHVCASVLDVWFREDYRRVVYATYYHADDFHLYYNMVSFLWKGRSLEPILGSSYMAVLIGLFGVLTNVVMLLINTAAERFLHSPHYLTDCAVGFSGVLFALKVLTTHMSPPNSQGFIFGMMPFPMKYMVWAELFIIQLIAPNVSFAGHLAGILVGLAYTSGPLKTLLDPFFLPARRRFTYRGRVGGDSWGDPGREQHYRDYSAGLSEEEQMRAAVDASLHQPAGAELSREEMRRRRMARFDS